MTQASFQYDDITDKTTRRKVESQTKEIRGLMERTGQSVVEIGRRMQAVHDLLPLKLFVAWVDCEFGWSRPQAINYMQAARVFGELDCLKQFQPAALVALARRSVPESAIAAAVTRARAGELITHKVAKSLLVAAGVQPQPKAGGVARSTPAADPVAALRSTLSTFVTDIDRWSETLSDDDRNDLADQFLQLAYQIRQAAPQPAGPPQRKGRRKLAAAS